MVKDMTRKNFLEVLKSAGIDIRAEYRRLHKLFYESGRMCLYDLCDAQFLRVPFRGTCISLEDFNQTHGFNYHVIPVEVNEDILISFCEYTYNLLVYMPDSPYDYYNGMSKQELYKKTLWDIIEKIGYHSIYDDQNGVTIFVPKSQNVISVSEILPDPLSYTVIEYNHYRMKGDLEGKKDILLKLGHLIEPQKKELQSINQSLATTIFFMLNNLNIRHNNVQKDSPSYKEITAMMDNAVLEDWYDELYQLLLLAFLEMDNIERMKKIDSLKKQYSS